MRGYFAGKDISFMVKFITPQEAASLIQDHAVLALGGFGAYCGPDALLAALGERFEETGHPADLTVVTGISTGDNSQDDVGMNRGPGGFINISQNTPKVCFMGAFTAGKSRIEIADGRLNIPEDGNRTKFIDKVQQITFSADYARKAGQTVLYLTERAVFRLAGEGIMLTEIAPGVDLEKDILAHMDFRPLMAEDLKLMDPRIFHEEKMGLRF